MVLLAALACSNPPPAPEPGPPPVEEAAVVLLVRHAEKAQDGTPDPPLTEAGTQRAQCLKQLLMPTHPQRVLTSQYQRTQATLAPTAEALAVTPQVIEAGDEAGWLAALREAKPGTVTVVAAHSNTVPQLVQALGGTMSDLDEKGNIPDDDYSRLVYVTLDAQGRATSSVVTNYCVPPT
ncbi:MAG: histidine phosphatase family protein [Myxococcota bacterium]